MRREDDDAYLNICALLALNELSKQIRKAERRQPVVAHSLHHSIGENRIKSDVLILVNRKSRKLFKGRTAGDAAVIVSFYFKR